MSTEKVNKKIHCPCGSYINSKSERQHKLTKKHIRYEKTGLVTVRKSSTKEYQRNRLKHNNNLRIKQREACKKWYEGNKVKLLEKRKAYPCRAKIKKKLEKSLEKIFKHRLICVAT